MPTAFRAISISLAIALSGCGYDFNGPTCRASPPLTLVPSRHVIAQLPFNLNGGEAYQDYSSLHLLATSSTASNDPSGESMATFDGQPTRIQTAPNLVIIPNGSERPVESLNSLPSAPCMALLGNG